MGLIIVPTLHPTAILRNSGDDSLGFAKFETTVIDDLRKALRLTKSQPQWDERAIWERDSVGRLRAQFPTADEVIEFCRSARGHLLAVDTETTGESPLTCRLICVGFASETGRVLCVPFLSKGGNPYWSGHDRARVEHAVSALLADVETPKVAHNYIFDSLVLWSNRMPLGGQIFCTMQMHHVIDSELPMGLGFCGTKYLDVRYWKDDVKGDEGWLGLDDVTMRSYNLRDCLVTLRLVPGFMQRIRQLGLLELYEEEMQVVGIMGRATVRGLQIDFQRRDEPNPVIPMKQKDGSVKYERGLGPVLTDQMNDALMRLRALSGDPTFDPLKPAALRDLIFGRLGLPVVKLSKSGLHPSTDKEAMVLLALAADTPEQRGGIKALADFKSAQKYLSTFVRGLPALGDGRLHVSWKLLATTGRMMSSPNCFDAETEILTPRGWVRGFELQANDQVAQWDAGRIEFVHPIEHIRGEAERLVHVRGEQHLDLAMTAEHRCLLRHRKTGELRVFSADNYPEDWQQLHAGVYSGPGIPYSLDEIRLAVAVQADGVTGEYKRGYLRLGFSKTRKVERLEALLQRLGAVYEKTEQRGLPDRAYRCWFKVRPCRLALRIQELLGGAKTFGAWVLQMNREQLDAFIEEVWHWDGCLTRRNHYSSSIKSNTEWVQAALALSGFRAAIRVYISKAGNPNWQIDVTRRDYSLTTNRTREVVEGRVPVWCVRVPSSFVIVRRNGRISVTGNCQNWSKKIKKIFGYDQRYVWPWKMVGVDLKQAEMRGIAYLSKSARLLEMYRRDLNVHTINAMLNLRARPNPGHKDLDPATEAFVISEALALGVPHPSTYQQMNDGPWAATRTLIKKDGFGRNYGADDDTVFRILRSDRDPETNELLFGALQKMDVQANGIVWRRVNHDIVRWWDEVQAQVKLQGFHKCPVSGRLRWFREGFKRTHILGHPNQTLIASIVNKRTIEIQAAYDRETSGQALIVQQVHDAVNAEVPVGYEKRAGEIMVDAFEQRVALPGFPDAYFPADKPTYGDHLDQI